METLKEISILLLGSKSIYVLLAGVVYLIVKWTKTKKDDILMQKVINIASLAYNSVELMKLKNCNQKEREGIGIFIKEYKKQMGKQPTNKTVQEALMEFSKNALKDKVLMNGISNIVKKELKKKATKKKF